MQRQFNRYLYLFLGFFYFKVEILYEGSKRIQKDKHMQ